MPPIPSKLSEEQKIDVIERHLLGETQTALAKEYGVSQTTIQKILRRANTKRAKPEKSTPATSIREFAKRARSILWRQDGKVKGTYDRWQRLVKEFETDGGMNKNQAIVQASKDFPCLKRLFREYNVGENDPHPDSHPDIHMWGQPAPLDGIECEEREQSHRENLSWAIDAAGRFLRTGEAPTKCPNDAAYYLYRQACDEPKDFLGKFTSVEMKGGDDLEEQRLARKSGKRSIAEIEEMLAVIGADNYSNFGTM